MLIKVISVDAPQTVQKGTRSWQTMDVSFKNLETGKVAGKTLVSFTYPEVWKFFKDAAPNTEVSVTTVKEGDFWQWTKAEVSSGVVAAPTASGASAQTPEARVYKNNYETSEEREWRQTRIGRQACINAAISMLKTDKNLPSLDDVLNTAEKLEEWVQRKSVKTDFSDLNDDIPQ